MPQSTSTPIKVDVSDRRGALDRLARLGVVAEFLRCLQSWELLDDLPSDFDTDSRRLLPELDALHMALFPQDITPDDPSPEWDLVIARERAMVARLFLRIAERPAQLREAAAEYVKQADDGMQGAADIMADTQRLYEEMLAEKGGA